MKEYKQLYGGGEGGGGGKGGKGGRGDGKDGDGEDGGDDGGGGGILIHLHIGSIIAVHVPVKPSVHN